MEGTNSNTTINVTIGKIAERLLIENKFEAEGVQMHKWEGEKDSKNYITEMKRGDIQFIGILNGNFEKDGYGLLNLSNEERYFGVYTDNLRSKHGLYQFPNKVSGDDKKIEREFFFGLFEQGKIFDHGTYLWIKEDKDKKMFNDFDSADFSCFVGDLDETRFKKGVFLTKSEDRYYVYYGTFNENNEKDGNGVYYYNSENDELIFGDISKNNFTESYLAQFDDDGNLTSGIFSKYDNERKITEYKEKEEMPENQSIFDKMFAFRNTIMSKDYFGQIFEVFKKVTEYITENVNLSTFDSQDNFPKLINVTFEFNKISIKEDIEKIL